MLRSTRLALGLVLCVVLFSAVFAHPEYQEQIPNGKNVLHGQWQGVGHMVPGGGGPRNPFGLDFAAAGHKWTKSLCEKDSDNDTLTNGQELGDPFCTWSVGQAPNRTHHITHPGFAEGHLPSIPSDTCLGVEPEANETIVDMTYNNFAIPSDTTTYACQRFDMPADVNARSNHIIRFDPIINRTDIVHHLIVFSCTDTVTSLDPWICGLEMPSGCKEFVWGWALGGKSECIPNDAGIPVGGNGPKFFIIQMHYNNVKNIKDAHDSSGVRMHLTTKLRKYDASTFQSGVTESDIAIPPKQKSYTIVSSCPAYCTEAAFSESGIKVYAYLLHMHLLGTRVRTDITFANGTTKLLGEVPAYDFNSQAWISINPPLTISRGDSLTTYCTYNSMDQTNVTLGGPSTYEEMCTSNFAYFPRIGGLDVCTNYTDTDGIEMGRCAGFDFFWDTGAKLPICDIEDIPPQVALISSTVLEQCRGGQQCSGLCRQSMLNWIRTSTCVKRNGLRTVLNNCGTYKADCLAFSDLFNSKCMHTCYFDEASADASCGVGRKCADYACSDASNDRVVAIAAAITIVSLIAIVGSAVLAIAKCARFKRKVEYVG